MRKQFYKTLETIVKKDSRVIVLLGDIGVFGCRNIFANHPKQIINVGVCEQSMVSMAAGLAKEGFIPIVHTIAPFMVERALEQLKLDVGYQMLPVKIVGIGGSYDYASLGLTHHCPADVSILKTIPNMVIVAPGNAKELDTLLTNTYDLGLPVYYRLSDYNHSENIDVTFRKSNVIKTGKKGTVIAVGNLLSSVLEATKDLDVSVLYFTTIEPFNARDLWDHYNTGKFIIVEPTYRGSLTADVTDAFLKKPIFVHSIGVIKDQPHFYGTKDEHDRLHGLTPAQIKSQIETYLC